MHCAFWLTRSTDALSSRGVNLMQRRLRPSRQGRQRRRRLGRRELPERRLSVKRSVSGVRARRTRGARNSRGVIRPDARTNMRGQTMTGMATRTVTPRGTRAARLEATVVEHRPREIYPPIRRPKVCVCRSCLEQRLHVWRRNSFCCLLQRLPVTSF